MATWASVSTRNQENVWFTVCESLWIFFWAGGKASFWMSEKNTGQVHSLPNGEWSKISFHMVNMYTDDTTIYYIGDSVNEVIFKFNRALEKLVTWCKLTSLVPPSRKCKWMILNRTKFTDPYPSLNLDGSIVSRTFLDGRILSRTFKKKEQKRAWWLQTGQKSLDRIGLSLSFEWSLPSLLTLVANLLLVVEFYKNKKKQAILPVASREYQAYPAITGVTGRWLIIRVNW